MDFARQQEMDSMFGSDSDDDEAELVPPPSAAPQLVSVRNMSVGGGRGMYADRDLPPGFLVLSEVPTVTWAAEQSDLSDPGNLLSALHLICTSAPALEVSRHLHPMRLEDADDDERAAALDILRQDDTESIARDSALGPGEIVRILLTLQHNGFISGFYRYLSLVNHSCVPNCIKFMPSASSMHASEIWTVRPVAAGEELTICYCTPLETTRQEMRAFLKSHHRFSCSCLDCCPITDTEMGSGRTGGRSIAPTVEEDFQSVIATAENELKWGIDKDPLSNCNMLIKMIADINSAIKGFKDKVVRGLPPPCRTKEQMKSVSSYQKLLARANKLVSESCARCIQEIDSIEQNEKNQSDTKVFFGHRTYVKSHYLLLGEGDVNGSFAKAPDCQRTFIQFCSEQYAINAISCLASQVTYLDSNHPALMDTNSDITASLDISMRCFGNAGEMRSLLKNIYPVLLELEEPGLCIKEGISDHAGCEFSFETGVALLRSYSLKCRGEVRRLKAMYSVHQRYPDSIRLHNESQGKSSSCYWGR